MSKMTDVRPHLPFDVNVPRRISDLDVTLPRHLPTHLPTNLTNLPSNLGLPTNLGLPSNLGVPEIDVDFAELADQLADAAHDARRRTVRLAEHLGRVGVRVGALGARGAVSSARTAGRGLRTGAKTARAHPTAALTIAGVAVVAVGAVVIVRRRRQEAHDSKFRLAPAA